MVTRQDQYNVEISQEDFTNFLEKCTLPLPPHLSQKFQRISKEFNNNIQYIMNYIYMIQRNQDQIPTGPNGAPHPGYNHDRAKLNHKYENLLQ